MTTIIPSPIPSLSRRRQGGFTLVELMLSTALSAVILAGVLSSFLFLGRSGATLQNYNDMEAQSRRAMEIFAEDVRQASTITWNTESSFTITVNSASITYAYSSGTGNFSRTDPVGTKNMITGVAPGSFNFKAFNINGTELPLGSTTDRTSSNITTKQVQISLTASRSRSTLATVTNKVLSARFILRNKPVTA